jgi:hypothetical protein
MRRFEVQLQRFPQVGESLFFSLALACDVEFEALGDAPLPLAPDGRGERSFHDFIVSQAKQPRSPSVADYSLLMPQRKNESKIKVRRQDVPQELYVQ